MKKLILYTAVLMMGMVSCTKLDETVYDKIPGDVYPENEEQVANLSVEAYTKLRTFADDEGWWFLAQEVSSDEFCAPTRETDWEDGGKWVAMHRHTWNNDIEGVNRMWGSMWEGVTSCNMVLDMLGDLKETEAIKKKKSEVKALRSLYYYYLIDNYGDVPYLTTSRNVPEKPYKVKREVIFDSLVNTLTTSLSDLKAVDNKLLFTRYTAFALLSKLYLNAEQYTGTAQWQLAMDYADSVIAGPYTFAGNVSETFKTANDKASEIIFCIPYDEDNFKGFRIHMRTLHYQQNLEFTMPVGPWNGLCVVPTFFDTYESNDLRKVAYHLYGLRKTPAGGDIYDQLTHKKLDINPHLPALVIKAANGHTPEQVRMTGARLGKYEIALGAGENLSNNFPLFRLTDFYFVKAECEVRLGISGNGKALVDQVRSRAGVSPFSSLSLDNLLAERGREMYCEGHRRQDQIRFNKWNQSWWEKDAHTSELNTFPIPKWATDVNSNLLLPAK